MKIKEPPCVVTLRKIAAYMGWTVKALLWRAEHELFPLDRLFFGQKRGFKYILYLDQLQKWQTAKRHATLAHIKSRRGYHAKNYSSPAKRATALKRAQDEKRRPDSQ